MSASAADRLAETQCVLEVKRSIQAEIEVSVQDLFGQRQETDNSVKGSATDAANPEDETTTLRRLDDVEARLGALRSKRKRRRRIALSLYLVDFVAMVIGFVLSSLIRSEAINVTQLAKSLGAFVPIYFIIALNLNVHNALVVEQTSKAIWRALTASIAAALMVVLVMFLLGNASEVSRQIFMVGVALSILFMSLSRKAIAKAGRDYLGGSAYANLCIYDQVKLTQHSGPGAVDAELLQLHPDLNDIAFVTKLGKLAQGMDKVIVHCRPSRRADWARVLHCLDVDTEIAWPELKQLAPIALRQRDGSITLQITTGRLQWHQQVIKRIFDLAVTIPLVIFLLPLYLLVALAIKLESRGPVLFVQDRIGLGNRPFKVLKFRSMYFEHCDNEQNIGTKRSDARVTRVGAFIRKTSIDELPQFFNVISGEMSIVGPRPHAAMSLAGDSLFWEVDQNYWRRHALKPGITGLAQVRGHRGNTVSEQHLRNRLLADLEYIENWSLLRDLQIVMKTIMVVHRQDAY